MLETKTIREKKDAELQRLLALKREKLREVNFKLAQGGLKNYRERRHLRKEIARILTVLHERRSSTKSKT